MGKFNTYLAVLSFALPCLTTTVVSAAEDNDTITQFYVHVGLIAGVYDGEVTVGELKQYGDIGLGTFNGIDGEMSVLDGKVYQAKADGTVVESADEVKIPYAVVTPFDVDQEVTLKAGVDYPQLKKLIDAQLPTLNTFYTIRIDGTFEMLKARSIAAQAKPYPTFKEVKEHNMPVFEHTDIEGTLMGFRSPSYVNGGLNRAGYHFHFLSKDKQHGGHVLNFRFKDDAVVKLDHSENFVLKMPAAADFSAVDLSDVQGVYDALYQ